MARNHQGTNRERSPYYGALQSLVDSLFADEEETVGGAAAGEARLVNGSEALAGDVATSNPAAGETVDAAAETLATPSATQSAAQAFGVSERAASLLGLGALVQQAATEAGNGAQSTPDAKASQSAQGAEEPMPMHVRRLDVVLAAEAADLPDDLLRIVKLLPPGEYTRERLCIQLNSALGGHAWGQVYGTVV